MFLITSAAYIEQEFISEIGLLPPSFLPLGNRCLFDYQITLAKQHSEHIYLSIPASYMPSIQELEIFNANSVQLIPVPEGLSLGESILYCLDKTGSLSEPLEILHGDTLFRELPAGQDVMSVSFNTGYYQRAQICEASDCILQTGMAVDGEKVVSGYFNFVDAGIFTQVLHENKGDFIKAINNYNKQRPLTAVMTPHWYDFGHINAYFNSRAAFTTERSFNSLTISPLTVAKKSCDYKKMQGESHWFTHIPAPLQIYTPKLIDSSIESCKDNGSYGYTLEYIYSLPLSDLFVFGRLDKETWRSIFQSCRGFLDLCSQLGEEFREESHIELSCDQLYLPKTIKRLNDFSKKSQFDIEKPVYLNGCLSPSLKTIAKESARYVKKTCTSDIAIVHGDFCFSNILYDFRTRRIKVIDPRGIDFSGRATLLGDKRYDLAKLYHSVIGLYDLIIAGRFKAKGIEGDWVLLDEGIDYHSKISKVFQDIFFADRPELKREIQAITIHLFLSMLPLHSDRPDRQNTMISNAIRLFKELIGDEECL